MIFTCSSFAGPFSSCIGNPLRGYDLCGYRYIAVLFHCLSLLAGLRNRNVLISIHLDFSKWRSTVSKRRSAQHQRTSLAIEVAVEVDTRHTCHRLRQAFWRKRGGKYRWSENNNGRIYQWENNNMDSIFLKSYYNHSLGILRRITQMLTLFFFST